MNWKALRSPEKSVTPPILEDCKDGLVQLVGAGPGDPDLMTRKGWKAIQKADVLVYDALVSQDLLDEIPLHIRRIYVGKRKGQHAMSQQQICTLLVSLANFGHNVVRLKGGDPLIFGRLSEELTALQKAGIQYQIIPGITAAAGCAASLGFPLTERATAPGLRLLTAHFCDDRELNWAALAQSQDTLVFYMGLTKAKTISQGLRSNGLPDDWPVLVVENGTRDNQRTVQTTLNELPNVIDQLRIQSPALIYVGQVVNSLTKNTPSLISVNSRQNLQSRSV